MHWPRSQKRGEPEEYEQHSCGCSETGCRQVGSAGSAVDELNDVPLGIEALTGRCRGADLPKKRQYYCYSIIPGYRFGKP